MTSPTFEAQVTRAQKLSAEFRSEGRIKDADDLDRTIEVLSELVSDEEDATPT